MYLTPLKQRKTITPAQEEELVTLIKRSRVLWGQLEEIEAAVCEISGDECGTNSRVLDVVCGNCFHKRSFRHVLAYIGVKVAPRAKVTS